MYKYKFFRFILGIKKNIRWRHRNCHKVFSIFFSFLSVGLLKSKVKINNYKFTNGFAAEVCTTEWCQTEISSKTQHFGRENVYNTFLDMIQSEFRTAESTE